MKTIFFLHSLVIIIIHAHAGIIAAGGAKAILAAKATPLLANMGAYLDRAKQRIPANFESYEAMCNYENLNGPMVVQAVNKNPNLINQMPAHIQSMLASGNFGQAANAMIGVPSNSSSSTIVGGALNAKKHVEATFKVVVSAPYVTTTASGTLPPDAGQYNIPIFGAQAADSAYSLPGILSCSVAGYLAQAIDGSTLAQVGGSLPAPFALVGVDPTAWYFIYTKTTAGPTVQAAMWSVTTNPKYPYTAFLKSMFGTVFHVSRARYILGNAAEQDQYGFAMEKSYLTTFGKTSGDTIDPDIFISPEQLQTGRADIDLGMSFTSRDYLLVPSDPINVPSGFRFGMFVEKYTHQKRAKG